MKFGQINLTEDEDYRNERLEDLDDHLSQSWDHDMDDDDKEAIRHYTSESGRSLNHALIHNWAKSPAASWMHDAIMKHADRHYGGEMHLYSGVNHNFGEDAKQSKDGILHSPAHISATHDFSVAHKFAGLADTSDDNRHILRIKVKTGDKILHVGRESENPHERETILPSGTKLKYSHTTKHVWPKTFEYGDHPSVKVPTATYNIHHFSIHRD